MKTILLVAPNEKLASTKVARLLSYCLQHDINIRTSNEVPEDNLTLCLAKAQHFPDSRLYLSLLRFYDRREQMRLLLSCAELRSYVPAFDCSSYIFKRFSACGSADSHKMRLSSDPTHGEDEVMQCFCEADVVSKVYMVQKTIVAIVSNRCLLRFEEGLRFDSLLDRNLIFGEKVTVEEARIREIAKFVSNLFAADLIAFDVVSTKNSAYVVDVNYFTHDSLDPAVWVPLWLREHECDL